MKFGSKDKEMKICLLNKVIKIKIKCNFLKYEIKDI